MGTVNNELSKVIDNIDIRPDADMPKIEKVPDVDIRQRIRQIKAGVEAVRRTIESRTILPNQQIQS